ncbi:MAG: NADH-quinone oxidoreductase subunit G [Gammaproteobacteria bacterium]|nr:NADH-quinone oxidoreductase subunit G [Gammaproteobacteria bacterium]
MNVNIEINGKELQAENGKMLIEVTDELGITVPRFCYHKNLSVSANCRMCLVEVEKAPKPMPACATPVTEGMKVFTHSPKALAAQKAVMEFLLINHPLDCPVCDQGGECDLQDFSIGYGEGKSQYVEAKRVIKDKDYGPLVATEMTRCIHCTRCVRFGQEIAGIREIGATGRGENMEIGTYIEKSIDSELSGNIIDICPVGALTSKPFRFHARAWEMQKHNGVAVHDCTGSNVEFHTLRGEIQRIIARENQDINDSWISDRDRYSYLGLNNEDRIFKPMIKKSGNWETVDWEEALNFTAEVIKNGVGTIGPDSLATLVSPNATLEEFYLAQKVTRGLGSHNIDHRLQQVDFRAQESDPLYPGLKMSVKQISEQNAILLIGSNIRKEQPIIAHQVRQATIINNAKISLVNTQHYEMNFNVSAEFADDANILNNLLALAKVLVQKDKIDVDKAFSKLISSAKVTDNHEQTIAELKTDEDSLVIVGNTAQTMSNYSQIKIIASFIATNTNSQLAILTHGGNSASAYIAGAVPHRGPCNQVEENGLTAQEMFNKDLTTYIIQNIEIEKDLIGGDSEEVINHLTKANTILISSFVTDKMKEYATIILPAAIYTESSGTYINVSGTHQSMNAITEAKADSKPVWKIWRVLGNLLNINNMDYMSSEEVKDEVLDILGDKDMQSSINWMDFELDQVSNRAEYKVKPLGIYAVDSIVRRADALQRTADGQQ